MIKIANSKQEYQNIINDMQQQGYTNTGIKFLDENNNYAKKPTQKRELTFEILPETIPQKSEEQIINEKINDLQDSVGDLFDIVKDMVVTPEEKTSFTDRIKHFFRVN